MNDAKARSKRGLLSTLALAALLAGCQPPPGPDQVAARFWQAWQTGDLKTAQAYCTATSAAQLSAIPPELREAQVRFERVVIEGNQASVDTLATLPTPAGSTAAPAARSLVTYLLREEESWQVEAARTQQALAPAAGVEELARRIEELGGKLARGVEDASKEIERKLPELQRDLEELGARTQKQIGEAIDELRRQLDEALKSEPEKPKGREI